MGRDEKIKIAVTAGIAAVVMLILLSVLAVSGVLSNTSNDEEKLAENITGYVENAAGGEAGSYGAVILGASKDSKTSNLDPSDTAMDKSAEGVTLAVFDPDDTSAQDDATKEAADEDNTKEDTSNADTAKADASVTALSKTGTSGKKTADEGNSFYKPKNAVLKDKYGSMKVDIKAQLKELFTYWSEGNMEAVRDLVHLERFETVSYSLKGSKDYYYYGEQNSAGLPNGNGVAVYADDQYYYGQWVNGVRSGEGTWISFYPSYSDNIVKEHLYSGQWSDDLPNGQGQEHFDYVEQPHSDKIVYLQNVIGGFAGGFYNGEMYIMTYEKNNVVTEWIGQCTSGRIEQVLNSKLDKKGRIPVLSERENYDHHLYMYEKDTKNNGVTGIITGGRIK